MNYWEKFANENAEYYILTSDVNYSTREGKEFFYKSGREFTASALKNLEVLDVDLPKGRALEIGCGIGRLTIPHSKVFKEVIAVDISSTMLKKLNDYCLANNISNIKTKLSHEDWNSYKFDYAYSFIVFQHIEDMEIIKEYIRKIAVALNKTGVAQFQFDTRPQSLIYKIRNILPDFVLLKNWKKGIRRIRRSEKELKDFFEEVGLRLVDEKYAGTEIHTFILTK